MSADRRSFVDQRGDPWFGRGDTGWSLFGQLDRAGTDRYLDDRAARGFNLVLASVPEAHYADNAPSNAAGDPPFTGEPFASEPNEAYWRHVDYVLAAARERGITLLLCPAYLGSDGADDGWAEDVAAAGEADLAAYGDFLAARYGGFPNVMWLIGHDRTPDDTVQAREAALAEQLPDDHLLGYGGASEDILGSPQWDAAEPAPHFETVYSYRGTPVDDVELGRDARPVRPVVYLEGRYEQEGEAPLGDQLLRRQTYGAFGAGAAAVFFGNNPIWHFESVSLYPFEGSWQTNLGSLGSQDTERAWRSLQVLRWWEMQPVTDGSVVRSGDGEGAERVAVLASPRQAFVYVPTARPLELDLSTLSGAGPVAVTRVDPRSGQAVPVGPVPADGRLVLPAAGTNAAGAEDWLYLASAG